MCFLPRGRTVRALAQAAQLAQIFPSVSPSAIANALGNAGGDVQRAAGLLLQAQESPAPRRAVLPQRARRVQSRLRHGVATVLRAATVPQRACIVCHHRCTRFSCNGFYWIACVAIGCRALQLAVACCHKLRRVATGLQRVPSLLRRGGVCVGRSEEADGSCVATRCGVLQLVLWCCNELRLQRAAVHCTT